MKIIILSSKSTWDIYPKDKKTGSQIGIYTVTSIVALHKTAKIREQLSTHQGMNGQRKGDTHTMEY